MSKLLILNQRNLNTWLFVVVISLAAIIYFSEEESTQLERLSDINMGDINVGDININSISTINIQHNQNQTSLNRIVNNKTGEHSWQITQPIEVAANNFRVNSIIKLLNAPVHNQYTLAEIDSKLIGLNNPGNNQTTSIQFNSLSSERKTIEPQTITFGITNPVTNLRYIKLNDTVYTIEDIYSPLISSHFSALVSLNLLPTNSVITKLILLNQTISRDKSGRWQSNISISADNVAKTLQYWLQTQAFGVHQYLSRKELGEIFIYVENSAQPIRFQITDTDPWLIIARPDIGLEYHLDVEAYGHLISPTDSSDD